MSDWKLDCVTVQVQCDQGITITSSEFSNGSSRKVVEERWNNKEAKLISRRESTDNCLNVGSETQAK